MTSDTRHQHLSDEQFTDLLAGAPCPRDVEEHLTFCDFCRTELAEVAASMEAFRGAGTAWASATAPAAVPVPSRWTLRWGQLPSLGASMTAMAAAGMLAFGLGFTPAALHRAPSARMATAVPSNAELADDNRMMQSIDQELGYRTQAAARHAGAQAVGQGSPDTAGRSAED